MSPAYFAIGWNPFAENSGSPHFAASSVDSVDEAEPCQIGIPGCWKGRGCVVAPDSSGRYVPDQLTSVDAGAVLADRRRAGGDAAAGRQCLRRRPK